MDGPMKMEETRRNGFRRVFSLLRLQVRYLALPWAATALIFALMASWSPRK